MKVALHSLRQMLQRAFGPGRERQPQLLSGPPSADPRRPVTRIDPNALFPG